MNRLLQTHWAGVSLLLVFVGAGMCSCAHHAVNASPGEQTDIVRLSPRSFPDLPEAIASFLEREGYSIPQCYLSEGPANVISGAFAKPGQLDWAVLASKEGASSILVFWNGATENVSPLASTPDDNFMQHVGGMGRQGFSRCIRAVDREFILGHAETNGSPEVPQIDHEGIEDAFVGKASVVHYLHGDTWLRLAGAD